MFRRRMNEFRDRLGYCRPDCSRLCARRMQNVDVQLTPVLLAGRYIQLIRTAAEDSVKCCIAINSINSCNTAVYCVKKRQPATLMFDRCLQVSKELYTQPLETASSLRRIYLQETPNVRV